MKDKLLWMFVLIMVYLETTFIEWPTRTILNIYARKENMNKFIKVSDWYLRAIHTPCHRMLLKVMGKANDKTKFRNYIEQVQQMRITAEKNLNTLSYYYDVY